MLDWFYLALERYGTSSAPRLARSAGTVPRWVVRRIAEAKLVRTLRHVWRHNELQRGRWQEAGVRWRDLRSARVLERIPLLDPDEVSTDPERFRCVPKDDVTFLMTTSGTGGRKRKIYFTTPDIDNQAILLGAALRRLPGRVVRPRAHRRHRRRVGPARHGAARRRKGGTPRLPYPEPVGAQAARMHPRGSSRRHHQPPHGDAPVHARRRRRRFPRARREIHRPVQPAAARVAPRAARGKMGRRRHRPLRHQRARRRHRRGVSRGAKGSTSPRPISGSRSSTPRPGKPVPDGAEGEIVITTLSRRAMPLVRYRIRDLSRFLPYTGRCSCGVPLRKIAPIRGRVDHMLILGPGLNFYPDEFDRAVFSVPGVTDYQITVGKKDYRDVLSLTVEMKEPDDGLRQPAHRGAEDRPLSRGSRHGEVHRPRRGVQGGPARDALEGPPQKRAHRRRARLLNGG